MVGVTCADWGHLSPHIGFRPKPGVAYGWVRIVTASDLLTSSAPYDWRDIVVFDEAPLVPEGVLAASVTASRQDLLTHLNVLSSLRGTPNIRVVDALEVFAPHEGTLIRLEALSEEYSVREAVTADAEAHWASQRPRANLNAPPDFDFSELLNLDAIEVGEPEQRIQTVSRIGSKAAGLGDRSHGPVGSAAQ